jgi:hypothetical protein
MSAMVDTGKAMDKTVQKVASAAEQQRETYRYWQKRSDAERMNATWELSLELYGRKGLALNAQGLQRSVVCIWRGQAR